LERENWDSVKKWLPVTEERFYPGEGAKAERKSAGDAKKVIYFPD